jgi:GT2 family glycosyltransferase
MNEKPLVSIITINYKQSAVTNDLLKSLNHVKAPSFEVIVVDNASGNDDHKKIDTSYSFVKLVVSEKNLGFAGGNNLGYKHASGEYILLLNNDTEVEPDFMLPMIELFKSNPRIGAMSPKIRYFYQPDTIQYAGFSPINILTLRMHAWGFKEIDNGQHDKIRQTDFAHGCAMMAPRRVIEHVGVMCDEYFLYYEEHDWSTRIRKAGYIIMYQPQSLVLHKESISVQKDSPLKTYYINRNRIFFMRRNFKGMKKLIPSLYLLLISIPKNFLTYLFSGKKEHLAAYRKAIAWHFNHPVKN